MVLSAPLAAIAWLFGHKGVWVFCLFAIVGGGLWGAWILNGGLGLEGYDVDGLAEVMALLVWVGCAVSLVTAWAWYWIIHLLGWLPYQRKRGPFAKA